MNLVARLSIVVLGACAGSPSKPANSVDGKVGGQSLVIAEAAWTVAPANLGTPWTGQAAYVVMSTKTGLCDRASTNTVLPGEKTVTIEMVDITGMATSAPSDAGSYTVPLESFWAPKTAWLSTSSFDMYCAHIGTGDARGGTIDIEGIGANAFTGQFDVTIDIGGEVTGTFAAQSCAGLANALTFTLPACQPSH
jgi:hypothetical protein